MAIFNGIEMAPPDPILGLTEAFKNDKAPDKINLGVGVYVGDAGVTPTLNTVTKAQKRLLASPDSVSYLPIAGNAEYNTEVQKLLFGDAFDSLSGRSFTAQTPGGTGALKVGADFIARNLPSKKIWVSAPTWANHSAVFKAAGVALGEYRYFDKTNNALDFEGLCEDLEKIPEGDSVLFHACCHNPTGVDPDESQWKVIADICKKRNLLPLVDFAYQGFARGIEEDAKGLRILIAQLPELIIANSFSKNFGLYKQRVGAVTLVCSDIDSCKCVSSQVKVCIRTNYSNPPAYGAALVATILGDPVLRNEWEEELTGMRNRINRVRGKLVDTLTDLGASQDFSFIKNQRGMFSFSGLSKAQVDILKAEYHIYIVDSGRINVAGITDGNIDRLCRAILSVL